MNLDKLIFEVAGNSTFQGFCVQCVQANHNPTFSENGAPDLVEKRRVLADAFDAEMKLRGSKLRAYRGM
ncbi:MAG: hypothetical protein ACYCTW_09160 [Sulfuricella sp.]